MSFLRFGGRGLPCLLASAAETAQLRLKDSTPSPGFLFRGNASED